MVPVIPNRAFVVRFGGISGEWFVFWRDAVTVIFCQASCRVACGGNNPSQQLVQLKSDEWNIILLYSEQTGSKIYVKTSVPAKLYIISIWKQENCRVRKLVYVEEIILYVSSWKNEHIYLNRVNVIWNLETRRSLRQFKRSVGSTFATSGTVHVHSTIVKFSSSVGSAGKHRAVGSLPPVFYYFWRESFLLFIKF